MRDPARIDRILAVVRTAWMEYLDLRLAQLLTNAVRPTRPCPQIFYAEDDRVECGLREISPDDLQPPPQTDVTILLSRERAIVLLGILERYAVTAQFSFEDRAECIALADLHEVIRRTIPESVQPDWNQQLISARVAVDRGEA